MRGFSFAGGNLDSGGRLRFEGGTIEEDLRRPNDMIGNSGLCKSQLAFGKTTPDRDRCEGEDGGAGRSKKAQTEGRKGGRYCAVTYSGENSVHILRTRRVRKG